MRWVPRKRLLVDYRVQGALMFRVLVYWFLFAVAISQVILSWNIFQGPDGPFMSHFRYEEMWQQYKVIVIAGLILLPVLLIDVAYISNRIVGPLNRVHKTLRSLAAGEPVDPIRFRKHDYFVAMAEELNAVSARMAILEQRATHNETAAIEPDDEPVLSH